MRRIAADRTYNRDASGRVRVSFIKKIKKMIAIRLRFDLSSPSIAPSDGLYLPIGERMLAFLNVDVSETIEDRLEQVNKRLRASIRTVKPHVTTIVISQNGK